MELDEKHHIRHWLIDFGSLFGAGNVDRPLPKIGRDYWLAPGGVLKSAVGFGFSVPKYREVEWPNFRRYEAVGRWEAEYFDPLEWRNEYPNPAFVRMTPRDAFWAAKLLMRFTREDLKAIVDTAEFVDADQAQYFLDVLVERQQRTGKFGIDILNPLDRFTVSDDRLEFENLSERYGFTAAGSTSYRVAWSLYDNAAGRILESLGTATTQREPYASLPELGRVVGSRSPLLTVEIASLHVAHADWERPLRVYLRSNGASYDIVGIERDSPPDYVPMQ